MLLGFLIFLFEFTKKYIIPITKKIILTPLIVITKLLRPVFLFVYKKYLFIRKKLYNSYSKSFFKIIIKKFNTHGVHITVFIIISFIITNNIYANSRSSNLIHKNSIAHVLFFGGENNESEYILEEGIVYTEQKNYGHGIQVETPLALEIIDTDQELGEMLDATTMAGGNTLIKPTISSTEDIITKQTLRDSTETYTVKEGDNLSSIAQLFGISINTILWENKLRAKDLIRPNQELKILPTSGISHIVKKGESLIKISKRYGVETDEILSFNQLSDPSQIYPNQRIIIPEGEPVYVPTPTQVATSQTNLDKITTIFKPSSIPKQSSQGMIWPTNCKVITQYWHSTHHGLDIDGETGDPLYAVADGIIEVSAWNNGGYGLQVVVNHQNGIKTRYAHCSKLITSRGESVKQGDVICLLGNTGRSTGSHVHFEVIVNGVRRNPLNYVSK